MARVKLTLSYAGGNCISYGEHFVTCCHPGQTLGDPWTPEEQKGMFRGPCWTGELGKSSSINSWHWPIDCELLTLSFGRTKTLRGDGCFPTTPIQGQGSTCSLFPSVWSEQKGSDTHGRRGQTWATGLRMTGDPSLRDYLMFQFQTKRFPMD